MPGHKGKYRLTDWFILVVNEILNKNIYNFYVEIYGEEIMNISSSGRLTAKIMMTTYPL